MWRRRSSLAMAISSRLFAPAFLLPPPSSSLVSRRPPLICKCSSTSDSHAPTRIDPPNVLQLAQQARISLTPQEAEEFRPKLEQIVDWFAQLQEVDLESISPTIRADGGVISTLRPDVPSVFQDRDAMLSSISKTEGPYIKVPKILKENME